MQTNLSPHWKPLDWNNISNSQPINLATPLTSLQPNQQLNLHVHQYPDHRMVIIETNRKKTDRKATIQGIQDTNWRSHYRVPTKLQQPTNPWCNNLEDAINQLNNQMLRNLNKVAPMKRRRSMKKAPKSLFNKDLLDQRKTMKKLGVKMA